MNTLKNFKSLLAEATAEKGRVEKSLRLVDDRLEALTKLQRLQSSALEFFTRMANAAQNQVAGVISEVVTSAVQIVNGPEYEFKVKFVMRRNSTEADLILVKNGHEVDPLGNSGLGVANIIAIALRAGFIVMEGRRDRFLALDEPTAALRVGRQTAAGEMLQGLCQRLGFQILLTTHSVELAEMVDRAYHVSMSQEGEARARLIEDKREIRNLMEEE